MQALQLPRASVHARSRARLEAFACIGSRCVALSRACARYNAQALPALLHFTEPKTPITHSRALRAQLSCA
eukprot:215744-Pleurochrysis_carterae.AAC.3